MSVISSFLLTNCCHLINLEFNQKTLNIYIFFSLEEGIVTEIRYFDDHHHENEEKCNETERNCFAQEKKNLNIQ